MVQQTSAQQPVNSMYNSMHLVRQLCAGVATDLLATYRQRSPEGVIPCLHVLLAFRLIPHWRAEKTCCILQQQL